MASLTQTTRYKRKLRRRRAGRKAKNARANHGTTPAFEVHSDAAVANAPLDQLSPEQQAARKG
ncbi:MAG: hypothetical protein AB8H79_16995 [Myxococcota bacterium]